MRLKTGIRCTRLNGVIQALIVRFFCFSIAAWRELDVDESDSSFTSVGIGFGEVGNVLPQSIALYFVWMPVATKIR